MATTSLTEHVPYYSRNWNNIASSLEKDQWIKYGKQTAELVLPFISLYRPAALPISYGLGLWNITQKSRSLFQGSEHQCQDVAEIAKNVAELAFTYFQLRAGLIVNTTLELLHHLSHLYQASSEDRVEKLWNCFSTSLYLFSLANPYTPYWTIASLMFHASFSFYQTYQAGKAVYQAGTYQHEKTPIVIAKGLMGLIRLYQAHQLNQHLKNIQALERQKIQALERLIKRAQEMDEEENLLLEEGNDTRSSANPSQDSAVKQEILDGHSPSEEEILLKKHPLKNLVQKIEGKRVVLINPTTGEKQDFGAYFHGYGKGLVKGANLRFQHKVTKEGSHVTELHFKINEIYKERVLKQLDVLEKLSPAQARQFAASLKGKTFTVDNKYQWDYQWAVPNYHVEDVGDMFLTPGSDLVKISLKGEQDIEGFHKFLKAFNLEEALSISTPQDLEKMKLKFLFKFFYPPEADKLKKEETFFQLSPEDLKQKIVEIAPEMKKHFENYQIQKTEILPGFARYSIPIDKEVRALGGRALTAGLIYPDHFEEPDFLTADLLDRTANIVKHGMLSFSMRKMASINKNGIHTSDSDRGVANSIFTNMVWQEDVDKQRLTEHFVYTTNIRFFFSLKALNRGSYQYYQDELGTKREPVYSNRKNILDFIRFFPFESAWARLTHEVMIPGRILPEEIRAVNVRTQEMREQLVAHFKKHDIIQISAEGKETVHGIPLDDFILVEKSISPKIVENCSDV